MRWQPIAAMRNYFEYDVRTVRIIRVLLRGVLAIVLVLCYMRLRGAYTARMGETLLFSIWLGATVGFVTNVIVTWSLLFIFVPLMKPLIARNLISTMRQNMPTGSDGNKTAGWTGSVGGLAVPRHLCLTAARRRCIVFRNASHFYANVSNR